MNKSDDFLESSTTSYFSNITLKLCQDLLYIVYIYTGAPRRSWRQIVYLVDGVDLTSDPRHANPTRSLDSKSERDRLGKLLVFKFPLGSFVNLIRRLAKYSFLFNIRRKALPRTDKKCPALPRRRHRHRNL